MLLLSSTPCIVGKLFVFGRRVCEQFEEHQAMNDRCTLHAMPLAQAETTVVAQPPANACKLHCVEFGHKNIELTEGARFPVS